MEDAMRNLARYRPGEAPLGRPHHHGPVAGRDRDQNDYGRRDKE